MTDMMTNEEKGGRVWPFVARYAAQVGLEDDLRGAIADMITDLLHLADDKAGGSGHVLTVATDNYRDECRHP